MKIAENAEDRLPPVGILTSDERTEWAQARDALIKGLSSNVFTSNCKTIFREIIQDISDFHNSIQLLLSRSNQQGLFGPDRELSLCGVSG